jgi:hypothetical protein
MGSSLFSLKGFTNCISNFEILIPFDLSPPQPAKYHMYDSADYSRLIDVLVCDKEHYGTGSIRLRVY